jgi:DNA-binding CsgD family transcriptional regulator
MPKSKSPLSQPKPRKSVAKPKGKAVKARAKSAAVKKGNALGLDSHSLWNALSQTPGVGVSITDAKGSLLFVNDTMMSLFSDATDIQYVGKQISDFHPPEFVEERLQMIQRVLREGKPLSLQHIYRGRNIHSTVWPIVDKAPPFSRVIVVSFSPCNGSLPAAVPDAIESFSTNYIDLGPLDCLTPRELEVLVLLGYGMSVPKAAALLHRSPKTVQRHKAAISQKLELHGQAEIVSMVASLGLELSHAKLQRFKR